MSPKAMRTVPRSAQTAFCPTEATLMATGTVAGAIDPSFSSSAAIEIWKVDLKGRDPILPLAGGAVASNERFHRLAWGKAGAGPRGILAGGLADGSIGVWDPNGMVGTDPGQAADESGRSLLASLQKHVGSVRGLEFNKYSTNLLASGSADAEICIWDLASPRKPSLYPALKNGSAVSAPDGEITFLSWNNKVQHILASTSTSGTTVVWDLKRQKPVISFTDPNGKRRCSALQWNPEVATQLIVASDDDRSPSLQVWDLRNSISPVKEFVGHQKGILSLAWCTLDPSLLLSCGKDNRTICWDSATGDIVSELVSEGNWYFDVQWSPVLPGIFSAASFDGKVELYNVMELQSTPESNTGQGFEARARGMKKPPVWMQKPSAASFGFGGKLASVANHYGESGNLQGAPVVTLKTVTTDSGMIERSVQFEEAIKGGEKATLLSYCDVKAAAGMDAEEREFWVYLKNLFVEDVRRGLLDVLGFEPPSKRDAQIDQLASQVESTVVEDLASEPTPTQEAEGDPDSFFDNLPSPMSKVEPVPTTEPEARSQLTLPVERAADGSDEKLNKALLLGDFEGAVAICLEHGRLADALIIAPMGGAELAYSARLECMRRSPKPYMGILKALIDSELENLINTKPVEEWRETLAALCTYAKADQWSGLCGALAQKLWQANHPQAAILCSICSGDVDSVVAFWSRKLPENFRQNVDLVQDLVEKCIVLGLATGQDGDNGRVNHLVAAYGEILASQGYPELALGYLDLLPGSFGPESEIGSLKDRIQRSGQLQVAPGPTQKVDSAQTVGAMAHADTTSYASQYNVHGSYRQPDYPSQPAYQPQPAYHSPTHQQMYQQPYQQPAQVYGAQTQAQQPPAADYYQATYPQEHTLAPQSQAMYGGMQQQHVYQPPQVAPIAPAVHAQAPSMFVPSVPVPEQPGVPAHPPAQFVPTAAQVVPPVQAGMPVGASSPSTTPRSPTVTSKPAGPPKGLTVECVDTSNVSQEMKHVITSLANLYQHCLSVTGSNPIKKKEMDDNSKRLAVLFYSLNNGDVSSKVCARLKELCQAVDSGDFATASHVQVGMTTTDWDECSAWLTALKRLIKTGSTLR